MATRYSSPDSFRYIRVNKTQDYVEKDLKERFLALSGELLRLLEQVDTTIETSSPTEVASEAAAVERIKKIVAARLIRSRLFGPDLFADPAWDIMLDLTIAMAEHRRISVSSLCIAANVPTTTALRCIKTMTGKGLLIISNDTSDGRRKYAILSQTVYQNMLAFASSIDS